MHTSPRPGSLSLFPNPNTSRPPTTARTPTPRGGRRSSESREQYQHRATTPLQDRRAQTPQAAQVDGSETLIHQHQQQYLTSSPPRHTAGRQTPLQNRTQSPEATPPAPSHEQPAPVEWPLSHPQQQQHHHHHHQENEDQLPPPRFDPSRAIAVRSSIAKHPLNDEEPSTGHQHPPALRSIFPTYNPELPLDEQEYAPTQVSPKRIPRAVISRQSYHDGDSILSPARSPQANNDEAGRWNRAGGGGLRGAAAAVPQEAPTVPKTSTVEQLKSYWKVANGWRAAPSEGRVYCMKLAQEKDAPVYTLSSATQPFYNIRLDPTSASAYVTVTRLDPNKPYKDNGSGSSSPSSSSSGGGSSKHWQEALTTTMEEESRRHRPNDGLVALLMPTPATKMAIERASDPTAVATAENECARLVWDDDSGNYFLVHPALATPFCVTIERSPAWSRVEYTLEHHESPRHLAKLTRDATGAGWLEIDTGLASKIQAVYVADVAITALVLVASADEKNQPAAVEAFEPPPLAPPPAATLAPGGGGGAGNVGGASGRSDSALSKMMRGGAGSGGWRGKDKTPMEAFEMDVESQDDGSKKSSSSNAKIKEGIDKLPFVLRVPVKMLKALFTCFIWVLTILFKCFKGVFGCCYSCVGSKY